ncbi:probable arabinosyltransferase ARAD1 isoform X1 [Selaginella moellendorffii]|nr:probable arabinosyltransferase ARAD1 isoform X1 [Selaginella moellendorffii]|eukprot:XP_002988055.2 probable arabinosyltransferase ARAD1 isoform X1 [Selaginella moellendorffii]
MPVALSKRSSSPVSPQILFDSPPEWSAKDKEQPQQQTMASRSCIVKIISFLLVFAISGTILQNSLAWPPRDDESPSKNGDTSDAATIFKPLLLPSTGATRSASRSLSSSCQIQGLDDRVLKVYMYDLPAEFHFGMLDAAISGGSWPRNISSLPRYPGGLYQQHSPEYWLTADLLSSADPSSRKSPCSAVRVADPATADIFFVPFFSSLSYNRYCRTGHRFQGGRGCVENDRLEKRLVEFLRGQELWRRNGGVDHVIVMHHPNSLMVARSLLKEAMFVVADFGRFSRAVANMRKDIVAPYKHVIPSFARDATTFESRETLLFFQGAIVRKEGGIIRQKLYEILKDSPGVHFVTGNTQKDGIRSATAGMRNAKFCLHLAGDTPSSNRLFDAIASHCVPVIISDEIELPFEDELDYSQFCVFVESDKALRKGFVVRALERIGRDEWTRKWAMLKSVERHFEYQHPSLPEDAVHMTWRGIAKRVPALKSTAHKIHRYDRH